jgi:3-hydroxybutyryl-CoA dehydrogenase
VFDKNIKLMRILISGSNIPMHQSFIDKISPGNEMIMAAEVHPGEKYDLLIAPDFDGSKEPNMSQITNISSAYYLLGSVKTQLGLISGLKKFKNLFGYNNLPGFDLADSLEYSTPFNEKLPEEVIHKLNFRTGLCIADRVGMVSPRIVCMIINEAYYTLQEGTAGKEDIDTGMKLGTAYPYGPFEWAEKIGLKNVYEVLKLIFEDTMDERYKICNLLKTEALGR